MATIIPTSPQQPSSAKLFYCHPCQAWYEFTKLNSWPLDDDRTIEKLCPNCDNVLARVQLDPNTDV